MSEWLTCSSVVVNRRRWQVRKMAGNTMKQWQHEMNVKGCAFCLSVIGPHTSFEIVRFSVTWSRTIHRHIAPATIPYQEWWYRSNVAYILHSLTFLQESITVIHWSNQITNFVRAQNVVFCGIGNKILTPFYVHVNPCRVPIKFDSLSICMYITKKLL